MTIVFLPATEPGDQTYGTIPRQLAVGGSTTIHQVHYPGMVWYNEARQAEATQQITALNADQITLVGFSKSGLGAWNIARTIPHLVSRTIIFDAPMVRRTIPPWGADDFYLDNDAWLQDLPLLTIDKFKRSMAPAHQLILISGAAFHDEMCSFSQALADARVDHLFLPHPNQKHHWNSGWIEVGLSHPPVSTDRV